MYMEKALSFGTLLIFSIIICYKMYAAKKLGQTPKIRRIAAVDAIDEAIGRAAEMGAPVHFSPGLGGVTDEEAAQTMASMRYLRYVAEQCGRYETKLIATIPNPAVFAMAEEVVREGFLAAGTPEAYTPDTVRFLSSQQMAYTSAVLGIFAREKPAANFLIGGFFAETMLLAEGAAQVGAMQIGGTARLFQLPYLIVTCDYTLIGEEVFSGAAYLSHDELQIGSIAGQDICKLACLCALVIGIVLRTLGVDIIYDFIGRFGQ